MLEPNLCLTLCDPMDCSLLGSSVHGISQERILEWVAMPSSRGYSHARDERMHPMAPALQVESSLLSHWGTPSYKYPVVKVHHVVFPKKLFLISH